MSKCKGTTSRPTRKQRFDAVKLLLNETPLSVKTRLAILEAVIAYGHECALNVLDHIDENPKQEVSRNETHYL